MRDLRSSAVIERSRRQARRAGRSASAGSAPPTSAAAASPLASAAGRRPTAASGSPGWSSTGSSSCLKIVQARSLLAFGICGLLDDRAQEAVGVPSWPWTPIREPIDAGLGVVGEGQVADGRPARPRSAVSMLSRSELMVFISRVSFSTSVTSACRLSCTNVFDRADRVGHGAASAFWSSPRSATSDGRDAGQVLHERPRPACRWSASVSVNCASSVTVSNSGPAALAERLRPPRRGCGSSRCRAGPGRRARSRRPRAGGRACRPC